MKAMVQVRGGGKGQAKKEEVEMIGEAVRRKPEQCDVTLRRKLCLYAEHANVRLVRLKQRQADRLGDGQQALRKCGGGGDSSQ